MAKKKAPKRISSIEPTEVSLKPQQPYWQEGWAAVIDVIGFRERLAKEPEKLASLYEEALTLAYPIATAAAMGITDSLDKVHVIKPIVKIFSDSVIVLARFDESVIDFSRRPHVVRKFINSSCFHYVMWATGRICDRFLLTGLPVRAGIAQGSIFIDERKRFDDLSFDRSIYMGDAIVRAYEWEQQQQWMWYSVSPVSVSKVPPIRQEEDYCVAPVPTDRGFVETYSGLVGSWDLGQAKSQKKLAENVASGLEKAYESGNVRHIERWRNTASMLDAVGVPVHLATKRWFEVWRLELTSKTVLRTGEPFRDL